MEYPFLKCPKKTDTAGGPWPITPVNLGGGIKKEDNIPEIMVQLAEQAIKVEEECMELLNLLAEFMEQKSLRTPENTESPYPMRLKPRNELY